MNEIGINLMSTDDGITSVLNSSPCRLCLHRRPHNADASQGHLRTLLHTLFSFWINPHDKFKLVCIECVNTVMAFYDYYQQVQNAQKRICKNSVDFISNNDNEIENSDHKEEKFEVSICKKEDWTEIDEQSNAHSKNSNKNIDPIKEEPIVSCDDGIRNNCIIAHSVSFKDEYVSSDEAEDIPDSVNCRLNETIHCSSSNSLPNSSKNYKKLTCSSPLKLDNINSTEEDGVSDSIVYNFPSEVYKNGKLILKGNVLKTAIRKFYDLDCNICEVKEKFTELNYLFKHYESEHHTKGYVVCCNSKLYNRKTICMHMGRHLQPSAFECPICKKLVSRPYFLHAHIQSHLPHSEKLYKCDECDKGFGNMSNLNHHKKIHIPVNQRDTFVCKICGKSYTLYTSLTAHMTTIHGNVKYLCDECGKSFHTKTNLMMHILTHDPTEKNKAICSKCGLIFKNKPCLQQHMKRHADLLQCTLCEFTTPLQERLKRHIIVKHSDSKPYSCVKCDKRFKLKKGLNTHMAQHTGERKFRCPFCPKTFVSSGNYYTHRKRMHSDEINRIKKNGLCDITN